MSPAADARGAGGRSDEAYLRRIVAGAATLAERLGPGFEPVPGPASLDLARERAARWRAKLAPSGPDAFARRLAWLGTTPEAAEPRLGDVRFTGPLPGWASRLGRALDAADAAAPAVDASLPFAALLAPFVGEARGALSAAFAPVATLEALDALLGEFAAELSRLAAPVFHVAFCAARGEVGLPASTAVHDAFVERMLRGGLRACLGTYPVLARLLGTMLGDAVDGGLALAAALADDAAEIARHFAGGRPVGRVVALRGSLSDRHDGGRTVSVLRFEGGLDLVHKPRDIAVERAWFDLLAEGGDDFGLLRVLARPGHGWVEFARASPCAAAGDVERFYDRAGALLCMLYALEASDCFFENIVARGAWPLLIDMETLMHPVVRARQDLSAAEAAADDVVFNSVFRAGFLPTWEVGPGGRANDISGLGAEPGQVTPYARRVWSHVGTDAMEVGRAPLLIDARDHLPVLDGAPARAADHVEAVVAGFARTYRRVMAGGPDGIGPGRLARRFAGAEIRFIAKPTRLYALLLKRLGAPRHMRDGADRSIEMEVIGRLALDARVPGGGALLAAEIAALDRLDVPKFRVRADGRALALPGGAVIEDFFAETAVERAGRRVASFGEADLALQVGFIRGAMSLASRVASHAAAAGPARDAEPDAEMTPSELVDEARAIAADLSARAIRSADGSATWIAAQLLPGSDRYELRPLRVDLYSGTAGPALFFAALDRVTGSGRDLALAALAPLRHYLRAADPARMARDGYTLGAATGAGAFAATLAWCADWLGEPSLAREAVDFCGRITPDWIAADAVYDVLGGSAGAVLGLLCLHRRCGDPAVLAKAVLCGEHLAAAAVAEGEGVAWPTPEGPPLTGLSHGAAGIAAALHRLAVAAAAPRFGALADRAVAWEDGTFDPGEGNWPDFRRIGAGGQTGRPFMCSWCHGAPGIGIGRADGLGGGARPALASGLGAALGRTARHGIGDRDGLCCGALGRAELFLQGGVDDEEAAARARHWAAQVVGRRRRSGSYRLTADRGAEFFDPSFFQGLSGIGYQLLRTAAPGRLPSVLSWE